MCAIVDADRAGLFFADNIDQEFVPLWDWINRGSGTLVVGGKLKRELFNMQRARDSIQVWEQAGRAAILPDDEVEAEARKVLDQCRSNDSHVIALARLSGARILLSGDKTLWDDFRDGGLLRPTGKVYRSTTHRSMLRHHQGCRFRRTTRRKRGR